MMSDRLLVVFVALILVAFLLGYLVRATIG
jgi:hypothetical protein